MKTRFPLLIAMLMLTMASLACGIFTAPDSTAPAPVSPSNEPPATLEAALPTAAPVADVQPTATPMVNAQPAAAPVVNTQPTATDALPTLVPAQDANNDGAIDICEVIPQSVLEATMGRTLTGPGQSFSDPALGEGCAFDFGKDNDAAYFAYVTIGTEQQFTNALANAVKAEPVTTIGDSAFLNYGPDARQLWVRVGKKSALVAIGDRENIPAAMIFARYLVDFAAVPADVTAASFAGTWTPVDPKPADSNKTPQYCQVDITGQGDQLTLKFASVCNPVMYIDFLTTTITFDSNPVAIKVKDAVGGEFTITLTLNGDKLNVATRYTDKDGNPGVNKSDDFTR
jgi:hypothetical protein